MLCKQLIKYVHEDKKQVPNLTVKVVGLTVYFKFQLILNY